MNELEIKTTIDKILINVKNFELNIKEMELKINQDLNNMKEKINILFDKNKQILFEKLNNKKTNFILKFNKYLKELNTIKRTKNYNSIDTKYLNLIFVQINDYFIENIINLTKNSNFKKLYENVDLYFVNFFNNYINLIECKNDIFNNNNINLINFKYNFNIKNYLKNFNKPKNIIKANNVLGKFKNPYKKNDRYKISKKSIIEFENGDVFKGDFNDSKRIYGFNYYKNINLFYKGNFKNNIPNLIGRYYFNNNKIYEGNIKNGFPNNKGIFINNNCNYKCIGNYKNFIKEGYFIENIDNNIFFKGNYKKNKKNNFGEIILQNEFIFKGNFKNNSLNGLGTLKNLNKKNQKIIKFKANFYKNKINGYVKIYYENGNIFIGEYIDNKINGYGILYNNIGEKIEESIYENDIKIL